MKYILIFAVTLLFYGGDSHAQSKNETNKALKKLNKWKQTNGEPVIDEEGRVLYVFGESMPQVVCAPLALCDIRMQPGEEIVSVRVGDKVRWVINNARSGTGDQTAEHLIVKPTSAGLSTTLFVGTDRRVYVIELLSDAKEFMSKVGFQYKEKFSENGQSKNNSDIELLPQADNQQVAIALPVLPSLPQEEIIKGHEVIAHALNFKYLVSGPRVSWRPIRVYDDGVKTFIDMDQRKVSSRELPIFLNNDTDRRGHMINYRYIPHDARFVVDGLFDKGSLVLGEGRKRKKVSIVREQVARQHNSTSYGE